MNTFEKDENNRDILLSAINAGWNAPSGTWTGGLSLTAFGDGKVVIIPQILIPGGQQITIGDALVSITVSMSRG